MYRSLTLQDIIAAYGGQTRLAAYLGCGVSAISNWSHCGIPKSRLLDLIELARELRLTGITPETLRAASANAIKYGPRPRGRPVDA